MPGHAGDCVYLNICHLLAMLWFVSRTAMSVTYASHDPEFGMPEAHKRLPQVPEESSSEVMGMILPSAFVLGLCQFSHADVFTRTSS